MSKIISIALLIVLIISTVFLCLAPLGISAWYLLGNFSQIVYQSKTSSYLLLSLFVAIVSASMAAVMGYFLHVAFGSFNSTQLTLVSLSLALPLLLPIIGVAFGLSNLLKSLQIEGNWIWIILGHFWLQVPIVFFLIGRFRSKNDSQLLFLVQSMQGSFLRRHFYGYLHIFKIPVLVSVYVAFIFSLEEGIVSWYVGGFDATFPVFMVEKLGSSVGGEVIGSGVLLFALELAVTTLVIRTKNVKNTKK